MSRGNKLRSFRRYANSKRPGLVEQRKFIGKTLLARQLFRKNRLLYRIVEYSGARRPAFISIGQSIAPVFVPLASAIANSCSSVLTATTKRFHASHNSSLHIRSVFVNGFECLRSAQSSYPSGDVLIVRHRRTYSGWFEFSERAGSNVPAGRGRALVLLG